MVTWLSDNESWLVPLSAAVTILTGIVVLFRWLSSRITLDDRANLPAKRISTNFDTDSTLWPVLFVNLSFHGLDGFIGDKISDVRLAVLQELQKVFVSVVLLDDTLLMRDGTKDGNGNQLPFLEVKASWKVGVLLEATIHDSDRRLGSFVIYCPVRPWWFILIMFDMREEKIASRRLKNAICRWMLQN